MTRFWNSALLCAALTVPIAMTPTMLRADDQNARTYHDKNHNDDHQWNGQEDRAYRLYVKQNHHHYHAFTTLNETDQQSYWDWRHEHSDALLKIDVH